MPSFKMQINFVKAVHVGLKDFGLVSPNFKTLSPYLVGLASAGYLPAEPATVCHFDKPAWSDSQIDKARRGPRAQQSPLGGAKYHIASPSPAQRVETTICDATGQLQLARAVGRQASNAPTKTYGGRVGDCKNATTRLWGPAQTHHGTVTCRSHAGS
jgi:hypothetical protein